MSPGNSTESERTRRVRQRDADHASFSELPAYALRERMRAGYSASDLRADLLSGIVVGIVALPLSMALAIAIGAAPQYGLYTAIVAGFVVALLGGSRLQVSGPTAAFVVILAPIVAKFGLGGLLLAGLMAGVMLLLMGLARLGRLVAFVPHPVTTGFTTGIAVVIATLQMKDFFGLSLAHMPESYTEKVSALWQARGSFVLSEFALGAGTLALLVIWPRITKKVPGPLAALPLAALAAWLLPSVFEGFQVATIASRFSTTLADGTVLAGIPQLPPMPEAPWNMPGPDGQPIGISMDLLRELLPSAFAIAMLGAIESLLAAVVADGMGRTRHNPDAELLAQGAGNIVAPFFGGIPATGAIARTVTNIRFGARSPISAMVHSLTVLVAILAAAPLLAYLPMASLAALLLLVAWNMSDARHFVHTLRVAPRSDVAVLLCCFGLTVAFDMVVGVSVGMVLASFLFMRRMADLTQTSLTPGESPELQGPVPEGALVYEISGPLFFGAAQKAMGALSHVSSGTKLVILRMDRVNALDATGLIALESALDNLKQQRVFAILANVQKQPLALLRKAEFEKHDWVLICNSLEDAFRAARAHLTTRGHTMVMQRPE